MSYEPIISIIVPAYNVEKYIEECISSIEKQKFVSYEIIIIDDGSTDSTPLICEQLKEKYANIIVIHQVNKGSSEARNIGIQQAKGDYILFIDSDDFITDNSLESIHMCIQNNNNPEIVISGFQEYHDEKKKIGKVVSYRDNSKNRISDNVDVYRYLKNKDAFGVPWIYCVKTDYIRNNDLFFCDGLYHEDEEWSIRLVFNCNDFVLNKEVVYCYRVRENSMSTTYNIKEAFDRLVIIELTLNEFAKEKYSVVEKEAIYSRIQALEFGNIVFLSTYRSDERYKELEDRVNNKINLLINSKQYHHRLCYLMVKIMGIRLASVFLRKAFDISKFTKEFGLNI